MLLDAEVAGQDATTAFFGLHRSEILQKPQYARLKIGQVEREKPMIRLPMPGDLSTVPYGEPTWLTPTFKSPYYKQSHRDLQKGL